MAILEDDKTTHSIKQSLADSSAIWQELAKIDILPKIKNKYLLTPELSPTFAK
jgi:hypothetical protein